MFMTLVTLHQTALASCDGISMSFFHAIHNMSLFMHVKCLIYGKINAFRSDEFSMWLELPGTTQQK